MRVVIIQSHRTKTVTNMFVTSTVNHKEDVSLCQRQEVTLSNYESFLNLGVHEVVDIIPAACCNHSGT